MLNISDRTVRVAKQVQSDGAPELVKAVENGEIKLGTAEGITSLPKEEQRELVAAGAVAVKAKATK